MKWPNLAVFALMISHAIAAPALQLSWLQGETPKTRMLSAGVWSKPAALESSAVTPLGSIWKLYVYSYLQAQALPEQRYLCTGSNPREEVYCCGAGQQVDRDQALVRSCGLYFSPKRLAIEPKAWRRFWLAHRAPAWLLDLASVQPGQLVSVTSLLQSLRDLPAQALAQDVLLDVVLRAQDTDVLAQLGSRFRVKTFSWSQALPAKNTAMPVGGFAGWLVDGTPVHAIGPGTSQAVLSNFAEPLSRALTAQRPKQMGRCIDVALFDRYPIQAVRQNGQLIQQGALRGAYEIEFAANGKRAGNVLPVNFSADTYLSNHGPGPRITARFDLEDYVAHVLEREASGTPPAAAMAMAVVIRSYVLQQASADTPCARIADSSATQRVAARAVNHLVWQAVSATAALVLDQPVRYHLDLIAPNQLSWQASVEAASRGQTYWQILRFSFPKAELVRAGAISQRCDVLPSAEDWLIAQISRWRMTLETQPGYEATQNFRVCRLQAQKPYVDRAAKRIYARGHQTLQERLELTHEYLHLAFAAHPNGQDESFVEDWARRLLGEN